MNINNYEINRIQNKMTYNNSKLQIFRIARKDSRLIKRKDLVLFCEKFKTDVKKKHKNGLMTITIQYPDKYYSGQVKSINEPLHYFTKDDYDEMDEDPNAYESFILTSCHYQIY